MRFLSAFPFGRGRENMVRNLKKIGFRTRPADRCPLLAANRPHSW